MFKLKRLKPLMQFQKHGGTLSFEHKETKKVHTIDITPKDYKVISKMLQRGKKYYLLMDNKHNLTRYKSLDEISSIINEPTIKLGELYIKDYVYVVLNRKLFMQYIDNINIVRTSNHSKRESNIQNTNKPNTSSDTLWSSIQKKPTKKHVRFDWNDHFLEGMRMHGNKDDAEAHADAMKKKITGKSHL